MFNFKTQLHNHQGRIAIRQEENQYTYHQVLISAHQISSHLLTEGDDLQGAHIAMMINPGLHYVSGLLGIWQAGGVAVPICLTYPAEAISYYLEDAGAKILLCSNEYMELLTPLAHSLDLKLLKVEGLLDRSPVERKMPGLESSRDAMILYTSGTTSKPKGVITTHDNIESQVTTLVSAWAWSPYDQIICFLPLHHVHGIINVVCCALWAGATIHFIPSFNSPAVIRLILEQPINIMMAVPTIYFKLIQYIDGLMSEEKQFIQSRLNGFRLMVSGSAALPVSVLQKWRLLSGHTLLERYGMTEIGMAISNPLHGIRKAGYIGVPLPGVQVRLVDDEGKVLPEGEPGEIQVKGANVFKAYWQRPIETLESFTPDGWFKTGDIAIIEEGYYRILGRSSIDIIKSGGYKISALEIEEILRTHEWIKDCAVIGLADEEWGEIVAAAIVCNDNLGLDFLLIKQWLQNKLPSYRIPKEFKLVLDLPRNAMGKVIKSEVKKLFDR